VLSGAGKHVSALPPTSTSKPQDTIHVNNVQTCYEDVQIVLEKNRKNESNQGGAPPKIEKHYLRDYTPPRPPPKTTQSPPKSSTRAPTWKYDVCVSFRRPKERVTSRIPDSIITQFTIHRAVNAYRTTEFYKGLTNKARHNLLMTPPYSAWKDLEGNFIPKFDFAAPMFKVAMKDKTCHLFKAYPKEEELAQMPEPGIFLKNNIPDSEHVRFFVTFDCRISQRTML